MSIHEDSVERDYQFDSRNMPGRFVVFDGDVHRVSSVYVASTGVHYLLYRDDEKRFQVAMPYECASCIF